MKTCPGEASVSRAKESFADSNVDEEMSSTIQENIFQLLDRAQRNKQISDLEVEELKDRIQALQLPQNPLDDLIHKLGGVGQVAELTGRSKRYVNRGKGFELVERTKDNVAERKSFQNGKKLVAIISQASSTGISLHAEKRAKNQRRRVHLTVQLPWSADQAVQQMGRTHRSNQVSAPVFKLIMCNSIRGESRFASCIARRLEELGALTRGDRTAAVGCNSSIQESSLESQYARSALLELKHMISHGRPTRTFDSLSGAYGVPLNGSKGSKGSKGKESLLGSAAKARSSDARDGERFFLSPDDVKDVERVQLFAKKDDVNRFLNRLLNFSLQQQESIFKAFELLMDEFVAFDKSTGRYEGKGFKDIRGSHTVRSREVICEDAEGNNTSMVTFSTDGRISFQQACDMLERDNNAKSGFYCKQASNNKPPYQLVCT